MPPLLAFCGGLAVANAQDESDIAAVINRQHAIKRLIEESIASSQIDLASHHRSQAKRDRARALNRHAVAAQETKRHQLANELLTSATSTMFQAVRMAGRPPELANKRARDFLVSTSRGRGRCGVAQSCGLPGT